jgi:group I intron endonuclease
MDYYSFECRTNINNNNCVYLIKNTLNNKVYIGSAVNFKKRIISHCNLLKKNKHHSSKLQNSWNKYGENLFVYGILEENIILTELINREQYFIDFFNSSKNGFNILPNAGTNFGNKWSKETKLNYSKIKKLLKLGEPVIQYDLNGNKVNEFPNMRIASKSLKLKNACNIGLCCRKKKNTVGGFKWEYKNKEKQKIYGFQEFEIKNIKTCPHCLSNNTKKLGFIKWKSKTKTNNNKQQYKCKNCNKVFNDTTNKLNSYNRNIEKYNLIFELYKNNKKTKEIATEVNLSVVSVNRIIKKWVI